MRPTLARSSEAGRRLRLVFLQNFSRRTRDETLARLDRCRKTSLRVVHPGIRLARRLLRAVLAELFVCARLLCACFRGRGGIRRGQLDRAACGRRRLARNCASEKALALARWHSQNYLDAASSLVAGIFVRAR